MPGCLEMPERVRMFRILAASDVPAGETHAQFVPCCAKRLTFLAAVRGRRHLPDRTEMFTRPGHLSTEISRGITTDNVRRTGGSPR